MGRLAVVFVLAYVKDRRGRSLPLPAGASEILSRWVIRIEEDLPTEMRTSERWTSAKDRITDRGRAPQDEAARLSLIMNWMWNSVLPLCQEAADQTGYGDLWRRMCQQKTKHSAEDTSFQIRTSTSTNTKAAASAASSAALTVADRDRGKAAERAAAVPRDTLVAAIDFHPDIWEQMDPIGLLESLITVWTPPSGATQP